MTVLFCPLIETSTFDIAFQYRQTYSLCMGSRRKVLSYTLISQMCMLSHALDQDLKAVCVRLCMKVYNVCVNNKGSGETARLYRLT